MKTAPELIASGMSKEIGAPEDYQKNAAKNSFPTNYDLRIPTAIDRKSDVTNLGANLNKLVIEESKHNRFSNSMTAEQKD